MLCLVNIALLAINKVLPRFIKFDNYVFEQRKRNIKSDCLKEETINYKKNKKTKEPECNLMQIMVIGHGSYQQLKAIKWLLAIIHGSGRRSRPAGWSRDLPRGYFVGGSLYSRMCILYFWAMVIMIRLIVYSMHVHVCLYIYIYIHTHIYMYIYIYICIYTHTCMCITYVCILCMYIYIYIYIYIHICPYCATVL